MQDKSDLGFCGENLGILQMNIWYKEDKIRASNPSKSHNHFYMNYSRKDLRANQQNTSQFSKV